MECPRCHFMNPSGAAVCQKCGLPIPKPEEPDRTKTLETTFYGLALGSLVASRYQVLEELGSGGMGKVYKVIDRETREKLALKLLRPDIIRDDQAVARFMNELKIAHQVSHRNICRIYHLGREDSSVFIIMEYVPGEDLKTFIRRSGQLSIGKAVSLARQVCDGLGEAHRLRIVHRDLKPHNIMIDTEGNAKIMDFGVARSLREEGLTQAGYAVGTPTYMAPEQVEGKEVDQRTDIYSLGIVLYEMVTGRPPFRGDTDFSVASKHIHAAPVTPASLNPLIPDELSRIILRCLKKDKRERFQNAAELCAALDKLDKRISVAEGKPGSEEAPRKLRLGRRSRAAAAAFALAVVLLAAYLYFNRNPDRLRSAGGGEPGVQSGWVNSIAVLPFDDLSPGRTPEYVCESLTDGIQVKLTSLEMLKVLSTLSTRRYAGQKKDPREIGRELGVAALLAGSVLAQNGQLRVSINLVRTTDGSVLLGDTYPRKREEILDLEDDIAGDVAGRLGVKLTAADRERSKRKDPKNDEDYEVFLKGRHFAKRFSDYDEEEDFRAAVETLNAYVGTHPDFALAFCSLGNVYEHQFVLHNNPADEYSMQGYYEKAYALDPDLEETNLGLGWSHFYRRDFDRSYGYFKRAAALGPDKSEVNWNVGSFFRSIGLDEKAIVFYEKALRTDPLNSSIHSFLADSFMFIGDYEKGLGSMERAIALDPENVGYRAYSIRLRILLGRLDEAEKRLAEAGEPGLKQKSFRQLSALIAALRADREKALAFLQENRRVDQAGESASGLTVASVYALLGMKGEAVRTIEEGIRDGFAESKMELYSYPLLRSYPYFAALKSAPEFKAILKRQKRLYDWRMKKYKDL